MGKRIISPILISILFVSGALLMITPAFATVTDSGVKSGLNWEYGETTVNSTTYYEFNNEMIFFDISGSYEDEYNYTYSYETGGYIYEYDIKCVYSSECEGNTTQYMTGNYTLEIEFLADYVNVWADTKSRADYNWYGLKLGNFYMDYWITDMTYIQHINQTTNNTYYQTCTKRNGATGEIVDVTHDTWDYWYWYNDTYNSSTWAGGTYDYIQHTRENVTFMIPMQLSTLTLTTRNGWVIGWSNLLCEYIIFNDTNSNGIFDAGSGSSMYNLPSLYFSDEFEGMMMPYAVDLDIEMGTYFKNNGTPTPRWNGTHYVYEPMTMEQQIPTGIDIPGLVDNFTLNWNEPNTTEDGLIEFSWNQHADELPTIVQVGGMMGASMNIWDLETDYNYANKLIVNKSGELKTETTNSFGEVVNSTVKNLVTNLSLAVPTYSAFFAPGKINNTQTKFVPKVANKWQFKLAEQLIGEAEFDNPFKENYTLVGAGVSGSNLTCTSIGSSVAKVLVEMGSNPLGSMMSSNPFISILYANDLYTLPATYNITVCYEILNYPTWSGHRIVHDPIFTIHTAPLTVSGAPPPFPLLELLIIIAIVIPIIVVPVVALVIYRKKR